MGNSEQSQVWVSVRSFVGSLYLIFPHGKPDDDGPSATVCVYACFSAGTEQRYGTYWCQDSLNTSNRGLRELAETVRTLISPHGL